MDYCDFMNFSWMNHAKWLEMSDLYNFYTQILFNFFCFQIIKIKKKCG
jgi:hypothetical protein